MKSHKALGKGLRALISETDLTTDDNAPVNQIAIQLIDPNPFQPRQEFDETSIDELKQSIQNHGLLQPVVVRPNGERYELILGERRLRACRAAGLESISAQVRIVESSEEMLELAILENVQRKDLNAIELATALRNLQQRYNLTQESIAEKMGVSRAHVANTLRLLKLPAQIQSALIADKLTMGHARALLSLETEREQLKLFERFMVNGNVSVRGAEELTRQHKSKKTSAAQKDEAPISSSEAKAIARVEDLLQRRLGTKVKIKPKGRGGTVEIIYYGPEDLNRLLDLLEHD
ncbi:ParB/RepB/Spo0J family partition protein [bacterium]|nr:ParB/RepB/Spo0J family partition protein [bacterium]MBU1637475.1 ParB/RepB/Spo0J family partition protein [bacterium]MBU1919734.1 ParB/RepB/Spo0J family partition protein [bacterium]